MIQLNLNQRWTRASMLAFGGVIAAILVATPVNAQNVGPILWAEETIHSEILNETRRLRITLPEGYNLPQFADERYAVLIVLDAELNSRFAMTPAAAWGLATADAPAIPRLIVVGVESNDSTRYHDTTPSFPGALEHG